MIFDKKNDTTEIFSGKKFGEYSNIRKIPEQYDGEYEIEILAEIIFDIWIEDMKINKNITKYED